MRTALLCSMLLVASFTFAQSPAPAAFEVASIKQARFESDAFFMGYSRAGTCARRFVSVNGNRIAFSEITLCMLIQAAYEIPNYQIVGAPAWMLKADQSNYYDVEARVATDTELTPNLAREMLRTLLADRFQLKLGCIDDENLNRYPGTNECVC
jgi:uncharacterized protein (TIGR03435 family)